MITATITQSATYDPRHGLCFRDPSAFIELITDAGAQLLKVISLDECAKRQISLEAATEEWCARFIGPNLRSLEAGYLSAEERRELVKRGILAAGTADWKGLNTDRPESPPVGDRRAKRAT